MIEDRISVQQQTRFLQYIHQIAALDDLQEMISQSLELLMDITHAEAAMLSFYDRTSNELVVKTSLGLPASSSPTCSRFSAKHGIGGYTLRHGYPVLLTDAATPPRHHAVPGEIPSCYHELYCLPLLLNETPIGVIYLFHPSSPNDQQEILTTLHHISLLLTPYLDKTRQIAEANRREDRLKDLIDIMSCMTTTLERDRLLEDIMSYAQELLEVEATSIWIKDEQTGELILHAATGKRSAQLYDVRVKADQGIIGYVINTGKKVIVNNVEESTHFYRTIDEQTGFTTRSVLCVPLRAPRIQLGGERGELKETIIGGAQALNKMNGAPFGQEDIVLFEMLASQSATVLQLSRLYKETDKMFWGIIKGITSFIDRKDPYTCGHSQRVSEFSVAIAQELDLSEETILRIRIGGMLHDVGKIAVPDEVLKKPGQLTDEEMEQMKRHPVHGINLLEESDLRWLLSRECLAIEEHHERLDGKGYPYGLQGIRTEEEEQAGKNKGAISIIGRIVAVADAFDAMASDRPYRPAMSADEVIRLLRTWGGSALDPDCVEALVRARKRGCIITQTERPGYEAPNYHHCFNTPPSSCPSEISRG